MFTGPIEDRLAIRELNDIYGDGVALKNAATWASVWTEDAQWDFAGKKIRGRTAIVDFWRQGISKYEAISYVAVPSAIEVSGELAVARCQIHEILKERDGVTHMVGGLYRDELTKLDGAWHFAKRSYQIIAQYTPPK